MIDRRSMLHLAAVAALLPAVAARAAARFTPPAGPMRYTRRLERELGDGASFTVVRSFAVRFVAEGQGFRLTGTQVAVEVDAPEKLAELARLERERAEASLFPLTLDAQGLIVGGEGRRPAAQLDEAVRAAAEVLAQSRGPDEREQMRRYLGAVHQSAGLALTELPRDLFAPPASPRIDRREVTLPDGETGVVTVTFSAVGDPATGLMREASREIVTEVAGGSRRTAESWQLAPA